MRINKGQGYWQTTHYPIGGCFRRAPEGGVEVTEVVREFPLYKGTNVEVRLADGNTAAVRKSQIVGLCYEPGE